MSYIWSSAVQDRIAATVVHLWKLSELPYAVEDKVLHRFGDLDFIPAFLNDEEGKTSQFCPLKYSVKLVL